MCALLPPLLCLFSALSFSLLARAALPPDSADAAIAVDQSDELLCYSLSASVTATVLPVEFSTRFVARAPVRSAVSKSFKTVFATIPELCNSSTWKELGTMEHGDLRSNGPA